LIVALDDPAAEVRTAAAEALTQASGLTVSPSPTDGRIDRAELDALKQWWRETRIADLASRAAPRSDES
jgi:hypothetical protein